MSQEKKYLLKYWISKKKYTKDNLVKDLESSLENILSELKYNVYPGKNYLVLKISGKEKYIDACYDKLNLDRDCSYRVKDELGEHLRLKAYRILADLELSFREFINRAMIEVAGFNWWNSLIPENIKTRVNEIEEKTEDKSLEVQHAIEFTHFNDLVQIITANFQDLSDDDNISADKLSKMMSECDSFEDFKNELNERRKIVSIWENVFSKYFEDKDEWLNLKKKIKNDVIQTRHKVMHHRMLRRHEVRKLKDCSEEAQRIIKLAKSGLSRKELKEAQKNLELITKSFQNSFQKVYSQNLISAFQKIDKRNKELIKSINTNIKISNINPNISDLINSMNWMSNIQLPPTNINDEKSEDEDKNKDEENNSDDDPKK